MYNKNLQVFKNFINIESRSRNIQSNLYKKNSAKIHLLFFNFFNSIFCFNKLLLKFNLNLFYFINNFYKNVLSISNVSFVDIFFINNNFNIFTYKKNIKKKIKYYRIFISPVRRYVTAIFRKTCKMLIKINISKRLKVWFTKSIYANLKTINFNNIDLYCSEIFKCVFYFLYRINFIYFIKLKNLYKFFNNIFNYQKNYIKNFIYNIKKHKKFKYNIKLNIKIIFKFLKMFSNFNYNNKFFIKKRFFNLMCQEFSDSISYIKNKYINKYIYLFDLYTNCNIKIKTYWNFSFVLKKKKKKNQGNLQKSFNFFYIINTIINKYIYFIFIHWINLFFIECTSQFSFDDKLFFKNNNKLFLVTVFNLYYEKKKYRVRGAKIWKAPKLCYLGYYKPSKFLLYCNKQNKCHENL